tara:strand:+ start:1816 stop:3051 length:1236 start_codon:yes stop_codon:yes gene_type:complete
MDVNQKKFFFFLILFNIILRVTASYFFGDTEVHMEWGRLVHNLNLTGVLGINVVLNEHIASPAYAVSGQIVLPSVFMPPLYAYYIFLLKVISFDLLSLINILIFSQIILSCISIYIFHKILLKFFKLKLCLIFSTIFSIFPLYVYSSTQASSITLQVFLLLFYFFYLLEFLDKKKSKDLILFSISSSLLILTRGEFFFFHLLTLIYFFVFLKFNLKAFLISIIISIILISPYLKRNYENFDAFVLTKSFGYNLLKGNNPDLKVEGSINFIEKNFNQKMIKIETNNKYEIKLDNFYKNEAYNIIKKDPIIYLNLYFKKILSFLFLDFKSSYLNYYNPIHIIPKIILSIFSFIGLFLFINKKGFFQFLCIFYISNIMIFSIFFILPRYSLILLPIQLILTFKVFELLRRKFFN